MTDAVSINIAGWLACLAFVLMIASYAINVANGFRRQKREVSFSDELITKKECDLREGLAIQRLSRVEQDVTIMRAEMRRDVGDLHEKINKVDKNVERIAGSLQPLTVQVSRLLDKLE